METTRTTAEGKARPASVSIITATNPARLSKAFSLTPDGALRKQGGGVLIRGNVQRVDVTGPEQLAEIIRRLTPAQALCFGVPSHDAEIVPQADLAKNPGAIARTREHFQWPDGGGLMLLDYDPPADGEALDFTSLLVSLTTAMPEVAMAPMVAIPSASSCIHKDDGTELRGIRGWHLFLFVETASDIPAIGATLEGRLWLAGHGRVQVSKSGAALLRTLVDASVWQPERLSFDGGAACGSGLIQKRLEHLEIRKADAAPMATPKALNNNEVGQVRKLQKAARELMAPEVAAAQELWLDERIAEAVKKHPETETEVIRDNLKRALANRELMGDFELLAKSGEVLTVGQLLDDPKKYHGWEFADPLERDYSGNDRRIAVARLMGNRPNIYSHAHGGQYFKLLRQARSLFLADGQYPEHLRAIADRLGCERLVYDFGGALVSVTGGKITPLRSAGVAHLAESIFGFQKIDEKKQALKPCQLPTELAARMLEARDCWTSIPKLTAVVNHPVITPDGEIVQRDGYHEKTGLLLATGRSWDIPDRPTLAQVRAAIATVWQPLSLMPFESPADAGAALSLLLTAVARPTLALAPMFLTSAPSYGHGKTLTGQVAALLAGGDGSVTTMHTDDTEQQKSLVALLLSGQPACLLDNQGAGSLISGDALAALLTGETFRSRILGKSEQAALPTRVLLIASGVNIGPAADLVRRTLTIRIDQREERPEAKAFPFCPVELARETRQAMQAAGALLLRAAFNAGAWDIKPERRMGSFGDFDRVVRRTVLWLIAEGLTPCPMADPLDTQAREAEADPGVAQIETLLSAWASFIGAVPIAAMDVIEKANMNTASPDAAAILQVADEVAGVGGGRINARRWGKYLAKHKGRVIGGHRLTQPTSLNGIRLWQVALEAKESFATSRARKPIEGGGFKSFSRDGGKQSPQSPQSHLNDYESAKAGEL